MAILEQRVSQSGAISWRAKVRIKGNPPASATFNRRVDAKQWAAKTESAIVEGKYFKHAGSKRLTLREVIHQYCNEGLGHLKDPHTRITHLAYWEKKLGDSYLADITLTRVLKHRTELTSSRSNSTANRYTATLSARKSSTGLARRTVMSCSNGEKLAEEKSKLALKPPKSYSIRLKRGERSITPTVKAVSKLSLGSS
jgi:hypothetical protein